VRAGSIVNAIPYVRAAAGFLDSQRHGQMSQMRVLKEGLVNTDLE